MADDSAIGDRDHVRLIKPAAPAEFREVGDCGHRLAVRVDEAIVAFDIVAFAHAVPVRPAFVRLQLALAFCEPVHRRKVEAMLSAEIGEVDNGDRFTAGIAESLPGQWGPFTLRAGQWTDVESYPAVSAVGPIDALLFRTQQFGGLDELQDLEFEIQLAIQIPSVLQVIVVVYPGTQ